MLRFIKRLFSHRSITLGWGSLAIIGLLLFTDPDKSMIGTKMLLLSLATPMVAVLFAHMARKALFDYPEADMRKLFAEALKTPLSAAITILALAIIMFGLLGLFGNETHAAEAKTFVPANAKVYLPVLRGEQQRFWPSHPQPYLLGALVEQESCISLTYSKCWSPLSRLKSQREEGAGLGQITRAYRADGSLRFDSIAEMRKQHPALSDLTWANVYQRPDLQLRAMVLEAKANWDKVTLSVPLENRALAFADAAYNGGYAGVQKERRACGLSSGCDPQQWFGHVENHCMKSTKPLYGGRSACAINREHVASVIQLRAPKYAKVWCQYV